MSLSNIFSRQHTLYMSSSTPVLLKMLNLIQAPLNSNYHSCDVFCFNGFTSCHGIDSADARHCPTLDDIDATTIFTSSIVRTMRALRVQHLRNVSLRLGPRDLGINLVPERSSACLFILKTCVSVLPLSRLLTYI